MKDRKPIKDSDRLKKVYFLSLGCPKNRVDTDVMAASLVQNGMMLVFDPKDADLIVINTCSFIHDARKESVDAILELAEYKNSGRCKFLVAAGCLPQRYGKELLESLPEIDLITGTGMPDKLPDLINGTVEDTKLLNGTHFLQKRDTPRLITEGQTSVYIKIADGCSRKCAFCAIPGIRGRAGSRSIKNIVNEAIKLVAGGALEINLVSQDTGAYGMDLKDGTTLVDLLIELNKIEGLRWIRILYLYPDTVTEKLLLTIDALEKVVPYLDIPVQHASPKMLKSMGRGHSKEKLKNIIGMARKYVRNAFLRTTVMVGFPGERAADIDELIEFIEFAAFNHLGAFRYSDENGTRAVKMTPKVSKRDSYNRWRKIMSVQKRVSEVSNKKLTGCEVSVLIEDIADESGYVLVGRHEGQAPEIDGVTYLVNFDAKPGMIVKGKVIEAKNYDVVVEPVII